MNRNCVDDFKSHVLTLDPQHKTRNILLYFLYRRMSSTVPSETKLDGDASSGVTNAASSSSTSSSAPKAVSSSSSSSSVQQQGGGNTFGNHWRMPQASTSLSDIWDTAYPLKVQNSLTRSKVRTFIR